MIQGMHMRVILVTVIGLFCIAAVSCMPYDPQSAQMMAISQAMQEGKSIVTEHGDRIDEAKVRNIQTRVHTKQDIEKWFGKASIVFPIDGQNPYGCMEGWSYSHMVNISNVTASGEIGRGNMGSEALAVLFGMDGKVCRWSLTRQLQDGKNPMAILGRPIDVARIKNIQPGVQTKQDIEAWFGKPAAIGIGDQPDDPKGCLDLWEYRNMTSIQGQSGRAFQVLRVKFNEQEKVCHSDYNSK